MLKDLLKTRGEFATTVNPYEIIDFLRPENFHNDDNINKKTTEASFLIRKII
jgi:hypothetical protein